MKDFSLHPKFRYFEKHQVKHLLASIRQFFGCEVRYYSNGIGVAEKFGVKISDNARRGTYIVSDNEALVLGRVIVANQPSYFFYCI